MPTHLDEFGTTLRAVVVERVSSTKVRPYDLTGVTVSFLFRKPSGVVVEVAADIESAKGGRAIYVIPEDFLDEEGPWQWQPKFVRDDGQWWGQREDLVVGSHLVPSS